MNAKGTREDFGNVRKLPSGRYQARWNRGGKVSSARTEDGRLSLTFATEEKARTWLREHADRIREGSWPPPTDSVATAVPRPPTLSELRREVADLRAEVALIRRWDMKAEELRAWLHELD